MDSGESLALSPTVAIRVMASGAGLVRPQPFDSVVGRPLDDAPRELHFRRMRPRLLTFGVVFAAAGLAAQQSPTGPVVFRAAVDIVEVDATVIDARGNAVSDLTASDFEVFEDGTLQTVASFARVDLPVQ